MTRLTKFLMLAFLSVALGAQTGCSTIKPVRKTIPGLFEHFKACGLHVQKVEGVLFQAVRASDGIVMYIDGAKVEVYDYNVNIPKQKRKLEKIARTGKMDILTIPVPAVVNGNLVMLTYTSHPKIHDIIKAFKSF